LKNSVIILLVAVFAAFAYPGLTQWQSFGGSPGTAADFRLLQSDGGHMTARVDLPGFWLSRYPAGGTSYDRVELPEAYAQGTVGSPETPSVVRLFALPFGTQPVVTVLDVDYTTYNGISLLPVQTPAVDMPTVPDGFRIDGVVYGSDAFYPADWAQAESNGVWGGINTGRILINPVRYNPVTGQMMVASSITVRVEFQGDVQAPAYPVSRTVLGAASRELVNFADFREAAGAPADAVGAEYIFLVHENHYDVVLPLVEFYHSIGYETTVETFTAAPSPGELKAGIADNYDTATTRFALIVGTDTEMPSYNYGGFLGDYWYACLVGTDLMPEVAVGRLTGSSAQISHQVDKIINGYLQYSFNDGNTTGIVPSTTVLAAHQEQYPGKYTQCCNELAAYDYGLCDVTFYKIYPPEGGTNAQVSGWFNDGIGTVGYRGHGDVLEWSWNAPGKWTKTNIDALTNTFMPPVFNIACYCGRYQQGECLSESFQWATGASSGNLGANNPSYTVPNHDYMKQIYIKLFDDGVFNVAEAINEATVVTMAMHGNLGETNAKMYFWFGDPAMELFSNDTENPQPLSIEAPANFSTGSQTITVTVTCNGNAVAGATASLSDGIDGTDHGMTFHETATSSSTGQAVFNVYIPEGTPMLYTGARKHDYNPVTATIGGVGVGGETSSGIPASAHVISAAPNPVSGTAVVSFTVPSPGLATVSVYDVAGRPVDTIHSGELAAGSHSVSWNASDFANGVYFVRLSSPAGTVATQVMVLK